MRPIEAIAARTGVGKTTIYRHYSNKKEVVADAIESMREEVLISEVGNLWAGIDALTEN